MLAYLNWFKENSVMLAGNTLGAMFLIGLGASIFLSPWREWWNWLRSKWGRYAFPVKLFKQWKRARDKRMGTRKAIERFWTDVICNAGENAVHAGQFTRSEINQWYLEFGKRLNLTELMPKQFVITRQDQRNLKGAILNRIGPEAREAFKAKKKERKTTAKAIRSQFRRAFRGTEAA